jgi:UDP-galactopyranose mutase
MIYDFLIVGSGLSGSILAERIASELGKKVLIVEKRDHIGGNCYDYRDNHGILVHKYGPHIFHTQSKKVWDYLSRFTEWLPYYHQVLAVIGDKKLPVPFNLNSLSLAFPNEISSALENSLLNKYGYGLKIPILKLMESDDIEFKKLADYIYQNIFLGYTLKQWGFRPEELDFSVTSRIPVFLSRDNRYFQDTYQGIPADGYTAMIERIVHHPNIQIELGTDYKDIIGSIKFDKLIYTGPIDYFFDDIHGKLPYRSLRFDFRSYPLRQFQETAQVNYPNSQDYTRITEFKHFNEFNSEYTTVVYEYPETYIPGMNEPYYPIPKDEYQEIYNRYSIEAEKLKGRVFFSGRLAEYKYYNMDQIVGIALMLFEKQIAKT